LSSHKILSAPVVDWKAQRLLGFVDMLDLVSFVLSLYNADIHQTPLDSNLLFEKSNQFFSKPIKEIIDLSKRNPLCQVLKTSPLWECISLFQRGLHRVVVTNEERKIVGILSQSDVVRFLAGKMDEHYSFFGKTVEELNLGTYSLITVRDTQPTIAALKILYEHKVSAVAVVNKEGILVGNLSASDLKGATIVTDSDQGADPFGSLFLPVITFLKQGGMVLPAILGMKNLVYVLSCPSRILLLFLCTDQVSCGHVHTKYCIQFRTVTHFSASRSSFMDCGRKGTPDRCHLSD
jgi:CBS domain-containing protein